MRLMMQATKYPSCLLVAFCLIICGCLGVNTNECCKSILFDSHGADHKVVGNRLGFYHIFGQYGARPGYKQEGGDFYIFFDEEKDVWTETKYFFGATLFSRLENDNTNYCLESYNNWYRFNGTDMVFSEKMNASCNSLKDVCCRNIKISSTNANLTTSANTSLYQENARDTLGEYHAIGTQNGRWVYQKKWEDRFLEYGNKYWLANTGVGKKSGHMHHDGGSICPEHITGEWQISSQDEKGRWSWTTDVELKVSCLTEAQAQTEAPKNTLPLITKSQLINRMSIEGKSLTI